ncbi:16S rRNA (guanine(527)-N(7))-methyltransferase RsmG [Synechococcus sp. Nb3U1]|uniref:16S rRNA (guanine(527)-N(7))-methyltransferase RsmG n=1 Tax=Synechococcus sp. Nb3U1 TaxID=1914529 RepID=UPI001F1877DB|nr:16S rRNA (guanine(527)-N(7))-methyltransferase RsmG [Synechococcus sp. Nb3U1]MCF2969836.1 16S rRNA (guanine(527)-N(7))-methyltransferase RsmG [Synechococcus sp. Nb3U1]
MTETEPSPSDSPQVLWERWPLYLGWQPTPLQQQQLQQLYPLVMAGNQTQNLTRITSLVDFWEKHLWDSLRGLTLLGDWDTLQAQLWRGIDIGTGAGFPGIPAQIALPQSTFTLLDSTQRKIAFVRETLQKLSLSQARAVAQRAETWGQTRQERGSYDVALARALAAAEICAEYCLPLLKLGGRAILYRGYWTEAEAQTLQQALKPLGGKLIQVEAFTTPLSQGVRHCLLLEKIAPTPELYPRAPGIPKRQPLGQSKPSS